MRRIALFAVMAVGLSATACSYSSTTTAQVPAAPGPVLVNSPSAATCVEYGFIPNTIAFSRCVEREHAARVAGRMARGYAEAQIVADARDACASYGLPSTSGYYGTCVDREVAARRYRDQATVADTFTQPVPPAPPPPPAGVQAFRDEYGFRYDGQGNRLDARGNIISPQSTRP
jgi:hypothetical protein